MRVAIIPARGGSKRIPRKNLKQFSGAPVISYSIKAAYESKLFDHVIVSTDDEEISEVAKSFGAEVPFKRPPELANDYATTVPVVKHALQWVNDNFGNVSFGCCIYATAPFVQAGDLVRAYEILDSQNVQGYVFTAASFPFPIQRAFKLDNDGYVNMFSPENYNKRSQDLEEAFQDAGQFYWGSYNSFLNEKIFFSNDSKAYLLQRHFVQDIDTHEDWRRAELMYEALKSNREIL